jgi:hypothetical protein
MGNPAPRDESELQPSARFSRKWERPQLSMQGGLTKGERTLREDWLVVGGGWRCAGAQELPCELVREWRFQGLGVPVKQLRSWRKGVGIERERERERQRERERERDGVEEAGRARSVLGMYPDPSYGTKC